MKYKHFKSKKNIDLFILLALGALKNEFLITNIELDPDYDFTNYDKYNLNTYFINDTINFREKYSTVLRASFGESVIFCWDDLERISSEFDITLRDDHDIISFIQEATEYVPDLTSQGMRPKFDDFQLNKLKINAINNIDKEIVFSGAFVGNSFSISPSGWKLFTELDLFGIPKNLNNKIYLELLAESYSLKEAGNYKLAFFTSYAALECYLNSKVNISNEKTRLKDSFSRLFKETFEVDDLNKHTIYTSISGDFDNFTSDRNEIAHGRSNLLISKSYSDEFLLFVLITIASNECRIDTFKDMFTQFT